MNVRHWDSLRWVKSVRAASCAACARLILGIDEMSNGSAEGSFTYATNLASNAANEKTDSETAVRDICKGNVAGIDVPSFT